jgi:hypothetical protein
MERLSKTTNELKEDSERKQELIDVRFHNVIVQQVVLTTFFFRNFARYVRNWKK